VDPVHASWTTVSARSMVDPHGGANGKSPENDRGGAPACRCSRGGGREGKRRCEELTMGLTRARGATERRGDEGEVVAAVGLDGSVLLCEGEGERGGEGCGIAPGWRCPIIGAGGRRGRPKTAGGGGNWHLHGCHYRE
jgi:hypothetical protein